MNLKDNLKKIRKENNMSQEELAEKLGVSRQSVSKWESGQAYPEMDKMLELCKLFNLNIDDLLNNDISEVKNNNQIKNTINKYADDFLGYITKTVKMFSAMKFKTKVKCIFEQLIIITLLFISFHLIGLFLSELVLSNILSFLPDRIYYSIYNILEAIFFLGTLVLGIIVLLHIFKIRYLDYYVIKDIPGNVEETNDNKEEPKEQKKTMFKEQKEEKIIIRDPKHSEYSFIKGLIKVFVLFIKVTLFFIAIGFICSFVAFVICTILSFLIIKSGLLFFGLLSMFLSFAIINYIILVLFYNFIFNHKSKKKRLALSFILSLIIVGVGIALITIGATEFNLIDRNNTNYFVEEEQTIEMNKDIVIPNYYGNLKFIEEDRKDIKVKANITKYEILKINEYDKNKYEIYTSLKEQKVMDLVRDIIKSINNKQIITEYNDEIYLYASKENIEILKKNLKTFEESETYYNNRIQELEEENSNLYQRIYKLEQINDENL